jgi:lipopolysaccharide transport system ATP-binding protein
MSTVIRVENLGKKYIIRHEERERYLALRDVIAKRAKGLAKRLQNPFSQKVASTPSKEDFWALKDIAFEVKQGDRLGIIGRNGAGKSTLLKVLSRITEPTTGRISIKGRVASLLEVGTGFHPELTGRENIYLNGAIMGMSQAEIKRKFDEIVAFAEVEKFLDTPVKRYSSGMYMRLAFSVAAHLEPEILIVDEVLAVGDAQFQKKCLGKMEEVGKEGRTVLFVSHNMGAVQNMCNRALLLINGKIELIEKPNLVIPKYLQMITMKQTQGEVFAFNKKNNISLKSIDFMNANGDILSSVQTGSPFILRLSFDSAESYNRILVSIAIFTYDDIRICVLNTDVSGADHLRIISPSTNIFCKVPKLSLTPGLYRISVKVMSSDNLLFWLPHSMELNVEGGDFYGTGKLPEPSWAGICMFENLWYDEQCKNVFQ